MIKKFPALKLALLSLFVIAAFSTGSALAQNSSTALTEVEGKKVCMITDQLFIKDQIPVDVEGKTYYGCCEMCKAKLKNHAENRTAVDPISGKQVDKAEAVIGAAPDGSIFYFESEENLNQYNPTAIN